MIRCRETALLIFPEQEYMMIDGFRECDFGEFENKNYQELSDRKSYQQWIDSEGTLGFPGGESMLEFKERTLGAFDQMIQYCIQKKYDNIAMVVHGGTIMSILDAYGFPPAAYYDWHVENAEGYRVRTYLEQWKFRKELVVDGKITRDRENKTKKQ
jgi:alpha-ribazole phosphatase